MITVVKLREVAIHLVLADCLRCRESSITLFYNQTHYTILGSTSSVDHQNPLATQNKRSAAATATGTTIIIMLYSPTHASSDLALYCCSNDENTPTSSPLCPSSSSSSSCCGFQERLIIQGPASAESFSWSDFPIVHHHSQQEYHQFFPSTSSSDSVLHSETTDDGSSISSDDASLCSSNCESVPSRASCDSRVNNGRRRVQFASTLEVRTYSVVLGVHPLCPSLPIELGWEYNPEPALVDLDTHEDYKWSASTSIRRRSHSERKELLRTVAGVSEEDLRKAEVRTITPKLSSSSSCKFSTSHSDLLALLDPQPQQQRRSCPV